MASVRMRTPRGAVVTVDESSVDSMFAAGFRRVESKPKHAEDKKSKSS